MAVEAIWQMVVWLLIGLGSVIGVLVLLAVIGCFLPRHHVAARSLRSKRPPEEVWNVVSDYAAAPSWHPEIKAVERLADKGGHDVWRETDRRGYPVQLETLEAVAPRRLVRAITDEGGPFSGQWEFEIEPMEDGSRVTLTERGQVPNPFFRLMFHLFMTPSFYIEIYLKALAAKLGDAATLELPESTNHRDTETLKRQKK